MVNVWDLLASLSSVQLGVGLAVTGAVVAIVIDWRLALLSLLFQYLFTSLLLSSMLPDGLAMVKLAAGAFASVTLYWTARRVEDALGTLQDGRRWFHSNREVYPMGLPFRFLALLFTALVLFALPERFILTLLPRAFIVPSFWLLAMGLVTILLTRDPLKTGMGLLTFQNGFELLYTLVEPGLAIVGLLGIGTILVGFVASSLAVALHLPAIEGQKLARSVTDPSSAEALTKAVEALEPAPAATEGMEIPSQEEVPA
ncbi:MAG: hypothetical protein ACRDIB_16120 [Ardenticatenaceae bacterium]